MIKGNIDNLTSSGFIEGWAFDDAVSSRPLAVRVLVSDGHEVACGLAHHFRQDLADVGYGFGWCAFKLRLNGSVDSVRNEPLSLCTSPDGAPFVTCANLPIVETPELLCETVDQVLEQDPTRLVSIGQLRSAERQMANFITRQGVAEFVRCAYVYVLSRQADDDGLLSYSRLLRSGAITPFGLINTLAESGEYRSRPRFLAPPNSAGFVFNG